MAVYRFARAVVPDSVNPVRSTTLTAKLPSTSTAATLYTDPTLSGVLSTAGTFTTDTTGFAEFCTNGVPLLDFYNGSTLIASSVVLADFLPVNAPLTSSGTLPTAYSNPGLPALSGVSSGTFVASNMPRNQAGGNLAALTTQVMTSTALFLTAGQVVTNLTFATATTAAVSPTNWWYALYSTAATPALLGQTADQTTTAMAANTGYTLALATPVTIATTGVYYASVMVKAGTVPTLLGAPALIAPASAGVLSTDKILAQTSGSALTTTAPATITSATSALTVPYVVAT